MSLRNLKMRLEDGIVSPIHITYLYDAHFMRRPQTFAIILRDDRLRYDTLSRVSYLSCSAG